tara:strand:+ start:793 stop:1113 length:321 start_codon:yes stop_codon:yes gene_type:complete
MKKIFSSTFIVILIVLTTFTKSSTKKLDKEIFDAKEELRFLNEKYELILLDHNFLSSPNKLFEYQYKFFENELIPIDIKNISQIEFKDQEVLINKLVDKSLIINGK